MQQSDNRNIRIVRRFDIAPEIVFDSFTDPASMRVWWTDDTTFDIDLRVGGHWTITRNESEFTFTMTGEYLAVDRPNKVSYTISMPQFSADIDIVTIDIAHDGKGGCEVIFVQTGPGIAAELQLLEPGIVSESEKGWTLGFDLMEAAWKKV